MGNMKVFALWTSVLCFFVASCAQQEKKEGTQNTPANTEVADPSKDQSEPAAAFTAEQKQQILAKWEKKAGTYEYLIEVGEGSMGTGKQIIKIQRKDADTWVVESEITITAKALGGLVSYNYKEEYSEMWKGTALQSLSDHIDDDGTICDVELTAQGNSFTGTVNGQPASFPLPHAIGISCWNLDELYPHFQPFSMMWVDKEKANIAGFKIQELGQEQVSIAGKSVTCKHVKLQKSESDKWEMWLNSAGVPVKHSDEVDGYKTDFILQSWK